MKPFTSRTICSSPNLCPQKKVCTAYLQAEPPSFHRQGKTGEKLGPGVQASRIACEAPLRVKPPAITARGVCPLTAAVPGEVHWHFYTMQTDANGASGKMWLYYYIII